MFNNTVETGLIILSNLDYTCVILGFYLLLGLANWWLHAKEQYNGPVMEKWEGRESEPTGIFTVPSQPKNVNKGIV